MAQSQPLTGTQHTSTPHLDEYLKGIRDEFDRLNHELDDTRKQRDEYITKYRSQVKELRELRQSMSSCETNTVCQDQDIAHAGVMDDNPSPLISPVSSSSKSFDGEDAASDHRGLHNQENEKEIEGERIQEGSDVGERGSGSYQNEMIVAPTITGTASLSLQADVIPANEPGYSSWNVEVDGDTTAPLNLNLVHKLTVTQAEAETRVTFSMDGKYLAATSDSGVVSIFDSETGKRIMHSVMKDPYHVGKPLPAYKCLGFSPDSKYLATGDKDGDVQIWVISQRRVRNTFRHQDSVYALNFSPNGRCIVTCSLDMAVIIWSLRDGSSRVLTASEFCPWIVRISPDGRYIASGDHSGKMQIWNVRTRKSVASWQGHSEPVESLVFTLDGKGLLSGSWDRQVIQWDVSSLSLGMSNPPISEMREISRLIGHTKEVVTVSISPDGKWIASGSWDETVRIWSAHDATLHCILRCPGMVWSVGFSPVGNYLAIGGYFEDVTIWNYVNP